MMWPDLVNAFYEFLGALLIANHCRAVMRDKAVAGVSIGSTVAFLGWSMWNMIYYPMLGQWCSFTAGLFVFASNALYVYLLVKYKNYDVLTSTALPQWTSRLS